MKKDCISIDKVNAWYKTNHALKNVTLNIPKKSITAFIGPSGCGKTTLLRSINRMNDLISGFRLEGNININGKDIYSRHEDTYVQELRKTIGMVFQSPNPLPMSVLDNLILPLQEHYKLPKHEYKEKALTKLRESAIYDEVKDHLSRSALKLSGGQQQRLCIARALLTCSHPGMLAVKACMEAKSLQEVIVLIVGLLLNFFSYFFSITYKRIEIYFFEETILYSYLYLYFEGGTVF